MATNPTSNMGENQQTVKMYPDKIRNVVMTNEGHDVDIIWNEEYSVSQGYTVKWWYLDQPSDVQEVTTISPGVTLKRVRTGTVIAARVAAENSVGQGELSDIVHVETVPRGPLRITAANNVRFPEPAITVELEGTDPFATMHVVSVENIDRNGDDKHQEMTGKAIIIHGLRASNEYEVTVHAQRGDLLSSPVRADRRILTVPGKVKGLCHEKLSANLYEVKWDDEAGVESYEIQWAAGGKDFATQKREVSWVILKDLEPGIQHRVRVAANNFSGRGHFSETYKFLTAPKTPENLEYKLLSTENVLLRCDTTEGATFYEFRVFPERSREPEIHDSNLPELETKLPFERVGFSVSAKNESGSSEISDQLHFKQVVRQVKLRSQQKAAIATNMESFKKPVIIDRTHSEVEASASLIKSGETGIIYGPLFSGKTSLCNYLIQSHAESEICIFIDFIEFEEFSTPMNFPQLLNTVMPDLSQQEMDIFISWIEENQESVLFLVDNIVSDGNSISPMCSIHSEDVPKNLLFNIFRRDRKIFPRSKVLCTTAQSNLITIIKPDRYLKLIGLRRRDAVETLENFGHGDLLKSCPHLEMFLASPGFLTVIASGLTRDDNGFDRSSKASILMKALAHILESKCDDSKQATLNIIKSKIDRQMAVERTPIKTSRSTVPLQDTVTGSVARPTTLDTIRLEEVLLRAIRIAYQMEPTQFKKLFKKDHLVAVLDSQSFVLACGLLRPEIHEKSKRLLSPIVNIQDEVSAKMEILKNFMSQCAEGICKNVVDNSKLTIDWIDCCIEVGDAELLRRFSPKICVENTMSEENLTQVEGFLRNPSSGIVKTQVHIKTSLDRAKSSRIESAINENPVGKFISVIKKDKGVKRSKSLLGKGSSSFQRSTRSSTRSNTAPGSACSPVIEDPAIEAQGNADE